MLHTCRWYSEIVECCKKCPPTKAMWRWLALTQRPHRTLQRWASSPKAKERLDGTYFVDVDTKWTDCILTLTRPVSHNLFCFFPGHKWARGALPGGTGTGQQSAGGGGHLSHLGSGRQNALWRLPELLPGHGQKFLLPRWDRARGGRSRWFKAFISLFKGFTWLICFILTRPLFPNTYGAYNSRWILRKTPIWLHRPTAVSLLPRRDVFWCN